MQNVEEKLILHPWQKIVGTMDYIEIKNEVVVVDVSMYQFKIGPSSELREVGAELDQLFGQKIFIQMSERDYLLKYKVRKNAPQILGRSADEGSVGYLKKPC